MAAKKLYRVLAVALLTLALIASVFPVGVFATDTVLTETSGLAAEGSSEIVGTPDTGEADGADSDVATDTKEESAESGTESVADGTEATTGTTGDTAGDSEKDKGISTGTVISIAIVAVIVVFAAIYCIKNKEKVAKFLREVKSELKKIVWTPWSQVKKNTFVVIVVVIICAIVGAIFDFLFSKGIITIGNFF